MKLRTLFRQVLQKSKRVVTFLKSPQNPLIKELKSAIASLSLAVNQETLLNKTRDSINDVIIPALTEFNNLTAEAIQKG